MCDCIGSFHKTLVPDFWGTGIQEHQTNTIAQTPSSALPEGKPGIISSMATTRPTTSSDASTPCPDEQQTPKQTVVDWRTPCLRLLNNKGLPTLKPTTSVAPRRPAHSHQDHPAACRRAHSRPSSPWQPPKKRTKTASIATPAVLLDYIPRHHKTVSPTDQ